VMEHNITMKLSCAIYTRAAKVLSRFLLGTSIVRSIYIRRSVAAGEALFPLSDLDLSFIIEPSSGAEINRLRARDTRARLAFPRLGECQIYTEDELAELIDLDPYRATLDRRYAIAVYGDAPTIPNRPIPRTETGRRLVFWFEHYIELARLQRNQRNMRKFALEIANALGVLEHRWNEPLTTRHETEHRIELPSADPFQSCLTLTARGHALLRPKLNVSTSPIQLSNLVITPTPAKIAPRKNLKVMTPEVFDLIVHLQDPSLWDLAADRFKKAGYAPPNRRERLLAARRWASGDKLRFPGFHTTTASQLMPRLAAAAEVLDLEVPFTPVSTPINAQTYYNRYYDRLVPFAAGLRKHATEQLNAIPDG